MLGEEKKGKVKKGWLAVRVDEDQRRFVIPIAYLYHPLFRRLLEAARDTYGYDYSSGPLRLPCSVDEFLRLRALVEHLAPRTRAKVMSSDPAMIGLEHGDCGEHRSARVRGSTPVCRYRYLCTHVGGETSRE
ncbi:unnamed protein product [Alopecurus aequalis]